MGYACPVPALNLERYSVWNRSLNHSNNAFGVRIFALRIKDPNMRFCAWPNAIEVFGEDFKVGNDIKLSINVKRMIVMVTLHDGTEQKILREVITSKLNGKDLISSASVTLE